jgi:transcriptional regulator with XRE-family HTH domain
MTIGKNIKLYRKQKKLTQSELAERANMSRSYLADIERDRYNPSVETLKSIAEALNIPVSLLLDEPESFDDLSNKEQPITLPSLTSKEERDIARDLEKMLSDLESNEALAFNGEPLDDQSRELLRISLENSMRLAKQLAKQKFTPRKHKK